MISGHITGREAHPVLAMPNERMLVGLSEEERGELWEMRRATMVNMEEYPLRNGYEPSSWGRADWVLEEFRKEHPVGVIIFLVLGGHRASKTEWRSKRTVQGLIRNANYKVWACQATQEASREAQQIPIYKYLPPEYKAESGKLRKGMKMKVNYTPWGGFTEDVFAVENQFGGTSECRFKFYSMNPRSLEGAEINEGWCDEEADLEWLEALLYRLVSRNGILFVTFTPRWGYTQTVRAILDGARTLEEGETDVGLLGVRDSRGKIIAPKKVPLVQENLAIQVPGHSVKGRVVYFHTAENPYPLGNWANMRETLKGANEDKILTTAYGIPTKSMMSQFPLFRDAVHVVSVNRFREIQKGGGTWYHFLDPCSGRNWFQCWIFVDVLNRGFVAGETPSFGHTSAYIPGEGDLGPWATPALGAPGQGELKHRWDGFPGDGQKEIGWGFTRYLEEIDRMEKLLTGNPGEESSSKIVISARWIDARYGNARKTSEERSVTTIEELSNLGMEFLAAPSEKYLDSGNSGGTGSLRMINQRLFYDVNRPVDLTNTPKLFCVETCPNVIWALKQWTGRDGTHGACKDPIDCLRMYVLAGCEYIDEAMLTPKTPWLAQFGR